MARVSKLTGDEFFRNSIINALVPPGLILVLFGGENTAITLCVSTLCAYVVDLIGYMEGSVVTLTCMFGAIFISILLASKHIITEGVIYLPFIASFGVLLSYWFFVILMHFPGLLSEADGFMPSLQVGMMSTLPLLCSTIITWYICTQLQVIDLGICFSICYFLYMMYFTTTTANSDKLTANSPLSCLCANTLKYMYAAPVMYSMVLFIVLHHHVIAIQSISDTVFSFTTALSIPVILMCYCAEVHLRQPKCVEFIDIMSVKIIKTIGMICLLMCQYDNPYLEDIKVFSKLHDTYANILFIIGVLSLVTIMWFSNNRGERIVQNNDDIVFLTPLPMVISLTGVIVCFGLFMGLPWYILPACEGGLILYAEFYERQFDFKNPFHTYLAIAFVLCTGLSAMVITLCFAQQTLWYLDFAFVTNTFQNSNKLVNIRLFCNFCSFLMCLAVITPPLLYKKSYRVIPDPVESSEDSDSLDMESEQLGYLPTSSTLSASNILRNCNEWVNNVICILTELLPCSSDAFVWLYTIVNLFITFMELLVREHVSLNKLRIVY